MRWLLHPASEFDRFVKIWDETNAACQGLPFLRADSVRPLLREFGSGRELIAIGTDDARKSAMGLLAPKGRGLWETFQPSQLPLGAWLVTPGLELEPVLAALLMKLPGFALAIGITQQDPILLPRPTDTPRLQTLDYIQTAWVEVTGSFEDYWNARGKNLRHNMRKQRSKLDADGIRTRLEVLRSPDEVGEALVDYGILESAGWKAAKGTAIHPDNSQGRFYRTMLEAFCEQGAGRIYRYRFGDKVVAVDLCIEADDVLVILKTTYDESNKTLSPAFLMREDAFKPLFSEGRIARVEFYGKLMDWHTRWTDRARTLYHVNYYRWSWLAAVQRAASRLRRQRNARSTAA